MERKRISNCPEEKLLLVSAAKAASATEPPDEVRRDRCAQMIGGPFDWDRFIRLADRQRCAAAAHHYIAAMDLKDLVPAGAMDVLEGRRLLAQALYIRKLAELKCVIPYLRENGLTPVVVKGIPLARRLYTDPAVRASRDLDLLCPEGDLEKADRLLEATGYSRFKGPIGREEYRAHHFHYVYVRGENMDSVVEVHWNLRAPVKGPLPDMRPLLDRLRVVEIDGIEVAALNEADTLWQLALSLSAADLLDLRDLADIRRLARLISPEEWPHLAAAGRETLTFNELSTALAMSERAFGPFLPAAARDFMRPGWPIRTALVPAYSAGGIAARRATFQDTRQLAVYFFMREGARRKTVFLWRLVFPDRAALIETRDSLEKPRHLRSLLKFHATGLWILLKVLGVITLSPVISGMKRVENGGAWHCS